MVLYMPVAKRELYVIDVINECGYDPQHRDVDELVVAAIQANG